MSRKRKYSDEGAYKADLINKLEAMFPGCMILKNDPSFRQGIPDLTILWNNKWALLEVKVDCNASERPNQGYYVNWAKGKSFGAKIYPENEEEVLHDLQQAFRA